jgi:Flp pilus assembly protein TadD
MRFGILATIAAALAAPALAEPGSEIGYPKGALGYDALVAGDYATAEAQLRKSRGAAKDDPARLINLGQVLARTGRTEQAARLFERARMAEEMEIILADGRRMNSADAATIALRSLRTAHSGGY